LTSFPEPLTPGLPASGRAPRPSESEEGRSVDLLERIAHEFRTPLTSILGFTELLIDPPAGSGSRGLSEQERYEHLRAIQRNGRQMLDLVADLVDISKLNSGRLLLNQVAVRPYELIQEVVTDMRFRAQRRGLTLSCHVQWPFPLAIQSDALRLRQALEALVSHCLRSTERGEVALRCAYFEDRGQGHLQLQIEDTSPGLSDEDLARLFKPFFEGGIRGSGSGLGLPLAQALLQALGGRLEAHSQPAVGNLFSLDLPIGPAAELTLAVREPVLVEAAQPDSNNRIQRCTGHVLVIEDGRDNQRLIQQLLSRSGATVVTAGNGVEALELLFPRRGRRRGESTTQAVPPEFDLILTDVEMPLMDGPSTVTELRRRGVQTPIVALTAHDTEGLGERLLALGCNQVLHKPLELGAFYSAINRWMGRAA
jgi:CheY-like chemotaxis protein